jgi:hypothetical protein
MTRRAIEKISKQELQYRQYAVQCAHEAGAANKAAIAAFEKRFPGAKARPDKFVKRWAHHLDTHGTVHTFASTGRPRKVGKKTALRASKLFKADWQPGSPAAKYSSTEWALRTNRALKNIQKKAGCTRGLGPNPPHVSATGGRGSMGGRGMGLHNP